MNIKVYQSGLKFVLINAVKRLYGGDVVFQHSLDHGIYASIICDTIIDKEELLRLKKYMDVMVEKNIPFNKKIVSKKEAYDFFSKKNQMEKANNALEIINPVLTLYELEGQYNYFYSYDMPKSTGELKLFDLHYISDNEIVLVYPLDGEIKFTMREHIYKCFSEYDNWLDLMGINYVSDVNSIIASGHIKDLIKKNDIKVDSDLHDIAKDIITNNKRVALIAGPSSSGKTTTSKKLSLYLSSMGYNSIAISLDDFYLPNDRKPVLPDGKKDYECLEALDLDLINKTVNDLLAGNEVHLPRYNFCIGETEYDDKATKIDSNTCLVIEGLHGINPNLLRNVDESLTYKIYISPLTPLNVDRHNYVSTTDNRLLRRLVRDFRTRGRSAEATLATWASVRDGEEKYIFPYTDTVDAILNTAYSYEIGMLKVYAEPLLYSIKMDSEFYFEARRLIDNLRTFYPVPSEYVPDDNLLREFIGGSIFEEE